MTNEEYRAERAALTLTAWTTPEDIARQVASLWNRCRILSASLTDAPISSTDPPVGAKRCWEVQVATLRVKISALPSFEFAPGAPTISVFVLVSTETELPKRSPY